ncbi:MAG: hypothetical protein U0M15_08860 [Bacillota bacterium]|nr:hypothetical protein [Bacillota bacterium]
MKYPIKRIIIFSAAVLAFGAAAVTGCHYWREASVDTDALWSQAVEKMTAWDSYNYTLNAEFTLDNYRKAETNINGTCDIQGNLHIYGEIMDTDLEIYQFGDVYYRQNTAANAETEWIMLENSPLPDNEILLMELYPKQYLLPTQGTAEFLEKEKEHGVIKYRYRITDAKDHQIAAEYLTGFQYEMSVNGETGEIMDATVEARSKSNQSGTWKIHVTFEDVNSGITLEAPQ